MATGSATVTRRDVEVDLLEGAAAAMKAMALLAPGSARPRAFAFGLVRV
jgi:hypothetical protein